MNKIYFEKIKYELVQGQPNKVWQDGELETTAKNQYNDYTNDDFHIIIAHTIYNEEQYLEQTLRNDILIEDLDMIHILDGAWKNGGDSPISTDNTISIIDKIRKETDVKIIYEKNPENTLWKSESVKRNYQLSAIEKLYPNEKYYVFVKDGDESIKFANGRETQWIKGSFAKWYPDVALLDTFGYGSTLGGSGVRFIPSGQGIHYYTEKSMVLHNINHEVIVDYNPNTNTGMPDTFINTFDKCLTSVFTFPSVFLVNHFNLRNKERLKEKQNFDNFRVTQRDNLSNCKYNDIHSHTLRSERLIEHT